MFFSVENRKHLKNEFAYSKSCGNRFLLVNSGNDIDDHLSSVDKISEYRIAEIVAEVYAFVRSDEYVEVAKRIQNLK